MIRFVTGAAVLVCCLGTVTPVVAGTISPSGSSGSGTTPSGVDPVYNFTFDIDGITGFATLNTVASGLGDGSMWATSGTLTVTSTTDQGMYTLLPVGPDETISPSGLFAVDNLIYPADNAYSGVNPGSGSGPSFLTYWGLLFGSGSGSSATEINIFANGDNSYSFWSETGGNYTVGESGGVAAVAPVPEPASLTTLGIGACGLLGYTWRRWQLAQKK